MPRRPRIHAPGLLYHIICRGNQQQQIFFDEQDYRAYLYRLAEVHETLPFRLYAYALMSNHVHLLVEAGTIPISNVMKVLQQRYSQYFNRKYEKKGHLFGSRYKPIICDRDDYLLELVRYIPLNPVRAKIVKNPEDYPWSSHRAYLAEKADVWLDRDSILKQFAKEKNLAQKRYADFVLQGVKHGHRDDLYSVRKQQVLGDDDFIDSLPLGALGDGPDNPVNSSLSEIEKLVCKALKTSPIQIRARNERNAACLRGVLALLAKKKGYSVVAIAKYLGYKPEAIYFNIKRIREEMLSNPSLKKQCQSLNI